MSYYAILIVHQKPYVIAVADGVDDLISALRSSLAIRYLQIDPIVSGIIARSCLVAKKDSGKSVACNVPLFDGARLYIQKGKS